MPSQAGKLLHMRERNIGIVRRVVVKIGSGVLTDHRGKFDPVHFARLTSDLLDVAREKELVVVSSGAIALGAERMGLASRPRDIPGKQAAAAVGQGLLMHRYENAFGPAGFATAQVLLTHDDFAHRFRYLSARHVFEKLLSARVIPILNENDTIAIQEIKLGDNDYLAGLVVGMIQADLLIILSDVDGLYTADPRIDPEAKKLGEVERITPEIERLAGGSISKVGTGGMITKIRAARRAAQVGTPTIIAPGKQLQCLLDVLAGKPIGTLFKATSRLSSRKRWLAHALKPKGLLLVDQGAKLALLEDKSSLLPAGIKSVVGGFRQGDPVDIADEQEMVFARGLATYSAEEIRLIAGCQTGAIEGLLGYKYLDEIVHRDDLVEL